MRAGAHTRKNRGRVLQRAPVGGGCGVGALGYQVRGMAFAHWDVVEVVELLGGLAEGVA